jgi:hypothetical protein
MELIISSESDGSDDEAPADAPATNLKVLFCDQPKREMLKATTSVSRSASRKRGRDKISAKSSAFAGLEVLILEGGTVTMQQKNLFELRLREHGARVSKGHDDALNTVISAFPVDVTRQRLIEDGIISNRSAFHVLQPAWLTASLTTKPPTCLPVCKFLQPETAPPQEEPADEEPSEGEEVDGNNRMGRTELRCVKISLKQQYPVNHKNIELVNKLKLLRSYERAVGGEDISKQTGKEEYVNHRQLVLAQAVTSLKHSKAVDFAQLRAQHSEDDEYVYKEAMKLPWINHSTALKIQSIVNNGICDEILDHQNNKPVRSSSGSSQAIRAHSEGGAAIASFLKIVGVGSGTAHSWFKAGYDSIPQIRTAVERCKRAEEHTSKLPALIIPRGDKGTGERAGRDSTITELKITESCRFGLLYHDQMKVGATCKEIEEMQTCLHSILTEDFGGGWEIEICGGTRRAGGVQVVRDEAEKNSKSASSDADFLMTRFNGYPTELVLGRLVETLKEKCKLDKRWLMVSEGHCNIENIRANANEVERGRWLVLDVLTVDVVDVSVMCSPPTVPTHAPLLATQI